MDSKTPPAPFPAAVIAKHRSLTPPEGEDPGVKKTKLWVDLIKSLLVPVVTAAIGALSVGAYSAHGQDQVKQQAEAGLKAARVPTNAAVEEITQLRAEVDALAAAVKTLVNTQPTPARPKQSRSPDPAPAKKAKAAVVQTLQAIQERIADAPALPLATPPGAPPATAPPPTPPPAPKP